MDTATEKGCAQVTGFTVTLSTSQAMIKALVATYWLGGGITTCDVPNNLSELYFNQPHVFIKNVTLGLLKTKHTVCYKIF